MRDVIVAAVTAVVVSVGVSYWLSQRAASNLRQELAVQSDQLAVATTALQQLRKGTSTIGLQVFSIGGGKCASSTDPKHLAKQGDVVQWPVNKPGAEARKCFQNGETVKIIAKPGNTSPFSPATPYDPNLIRADVSGSVGRYLYEVWLADKDGNNLYLMEDPELEIVETFAIKK